MVKANIEIIQLMMKQKQIKREKPDNNLCKNKAI